MSGLPSPLGIIPVRGIPGGPAHIGVRIGALDPIGVRIGHSRGHPTGMAVSRGVCVVDAVSVRTNCPALTLYVDSLQSAVDLPHQIPPRFLIICFQGGSA